MSFIQSLRVSVSFSLKKFLVSYKFFHNIQIIGSCYGTTVILYYSRIQSLDTFKLRESINIQQLDTIIIRYHNYTTSSQIITQTSKKFFFFFGGSGELLISFWLFWLRKICWPLTINIHKTLRTHTELKPQQLAMLQCLSTKSPSATSSIPASPAAIDVNGYPPGSQGNGIVIIDWLLLCMSYVRINEWVNYAKAVNCDLKFIPCGAVILLE